MFYTANQTIFSLDIQGVEDREGTKLQVLAFDGIEAVNSEYIFEITLVSKHLRYDITRLLSKAAYLSFTPDKKQGIHGVILSVKRAAIGHDYSLFKLLLAPKFYHLYHEVNQRAFVNQSVPEIISTVLSEKGYQQGDNMDFLFKFKEDYPKREFCCQYDETTAHFIHRLCEEEGINIYYQHSQDNHCMVLTDDNNFFPNLENSFTYASDTGFVADHPVFKRFDVNLKSSATSASYRNYNFENMKIPEGNAKGEQSQKANNAQEPNLEYYDYPQQHMNKARGDHYSKIQIERLKSFHIVAEGYTDIPELKSGYCFEIEGYPQLDSLDSADKWLTVQIYHQGRQPQVIEALGSEASAVQNTPSQLHKYYRHPINEGIQFPFDEEFKQGYRNVLVGTPKKTPHRPQKLHPKSQVLGSQTAIVTGATGEEIYCDKYGRIKILFHWDRTNPANEHSSHWVRVASSWAHDGYGAVVIPRVGMEVKVDFLEGDIDNPIVTGAIHNGVNKVPYDLPANKTRSVFKTSSSKGGVGSNELRIEDKAGQEQIFVQSQKDFDQLTKNNHTVQVNNNSHLQVNNEHSETIKANRYTHNKSEEHHLTNLDRKTQVMMNDYKTVAMSDHKTIGTITTTQAGQEIHLKAGMNIVIDGGLSLTLKAGGQHIVLNPAGVWMTMPVFTGGFPMEGTPAMPLPPINKLKSVPATVAPSVQLGNLALNTLQKQAIQNAEDEIIKFNIRLTDIPGESGFPLSHAPWEILHLPNGPDFDGHGHEPEDALIFKGEADDDGKINLSDEQQKELSKRYKRSPNALWLKYPGQCCPIMVYEEDEQYINQHALDVMGYVHSDNLNLFESSPIKKQMMEMFKASEPKEATPKERFDKLDKK